MDRLEVSLRLFVTFFPVCLLFFSSLTVRRPHSFFDRLTRFVARKRFGIDESCAVAISDAMTRARMAKEIKVFILTAMRYRQGICIAIIFPVELNGIKIS